MLHRGGAVHVYAPVHADHGAAAEGDENPQLVAPMPGTVVLVPAADGDVVDVGDPIVVVEAMKMEHVIRANAAGAVRHRVALGDAVARGQQLAEIMPHETAKEPSL